ncbi:MAG: MmcQ/YjbR family DNA-binding protein [Erysipelotrichales bacterium]|nr:MmcQ/YjbR family DNA-binding protein [Erysipelotrichales bacterium]
MKSKIKSLIYLVIVSVGFLSLTGCTGDYDNFMEYIRAEWRWWNILLVILLVLLVIFIILLVYTLLSGKKPIKKVVVQAPATNANILEDAVNKSTEKTLNGSALVMDAFYKECKIPLTVTKEFSIEDIDQYICNKKNITKVEASGKKPTSFKIKGGKSFALLFDLGDGKYKLTFKCGPAYGAKLVEYFKDTVYVSKFPYGIIWFTISNENKNTSLELIKQVIDISYEIAKIGH